MQLFRYFITQGVPPVVGHSALCYYLAPFQGLGIVVWPFFYKNLYQNIICFFSYFNQRLCLRCMVGLSFKSFYWLHRFYFFVPTPGVARGYYISPFQGLKIKDNLIILHTIFQIDFFVLCTHISLLPFKHYPN